MKHTSLSLLVTAATLATSAGASTLDVQVVDRNGQSVAGAVVTLTLPGAPAPVPRGVYTMAQRNIAFEPHLLVVPVGATVAFPNYDQARHHVYSFSPTKRFELKLYGRDEARRLVFDKPGPVALGCNIHDRMSGFIYVTAAPFYAVTDAAGRARLSVEGQGRGVLTAWSPNLRAPGNAASQPVSVGTQAQSVLLRAVG